MASNLQNKNLAEYTESMNEISLHSIFNCFENSFCDRFSNAGSEFSNTDLRFVLTGLSYEPSFLWRENDYFVTQIGLGREINLTLKISDTAANLIFLNTLGKRQDEPGFLKLKDITELEARILTAFNEFLYRHINELFLNPKEINSILHTLKNEKTAYLTFYIYTNNDQEAGRVILSFPRSVFRKIEPVSKPESLLRMDFFNDTYVETNILVGKTQASLDEIKNIEPEDVIILENSNLHTMYLREFENVNININPSSSLVIDFEDEEDGEGIVIEEKDKKSIWDSLEVEVNASFEKVKMKLGDLREITEGLVVDVASVANNKVYIDVEGKKLAAGELVIIGDNYGIRITDIFDEAKSAEVEKLEEQGSELSVQTAEKPEEETESEEESEDMEIDEDFEESDFEIDDEDEEE